MSPQFLVIAQLYFFLFAGHFLCDYPLQGQFLADGKNFTKPLPGVPWYQCMLAHAFIHAGMVLLVTHSVILALIELILHFLIDCGKCKGYYNYNGDQILHLVCKVAYVGVLVYAKLHF